MDARRQDDDGRGAATAELAARLAGAVADLADRLRPLPSSRLVGCPPELGGPSRAAAAHALAQQLADVAAGLEHPRGADPPERRQLPDLGPFVVGDQLAVTGADVLAAVVAALEPSSPGTSDGAHADLDSMLTECLAAATVLRRCV